MANLSKIKREQLLSKIENLKKNLKDPNDIESLNTINEIQKEIQNKKYGLVWEEHSEAVDEMLKDNIPVFTEDKSREIVSDPNLPYNFLIEGDNLHALKLLEKTHKGKIDVIYIDPPYNTGNKDFVYDDCFVEQEDAYRHSKWLSFITNRLNIAKLLLKDDGLIFISIDDNEVADLKLLLDDIHGETNLYSILCVEMSKTQGMKVKSAQNGSIVKNQEYILVYGTNKELSKLNRCPLYDKSEPWDNHFNCVLVAKNENEFIKYDLSDYLNTHHKEIYELFCKFDLVDKKGKISPENFAKGIIINPKIKHLLYVELSNVIYQQMACSIKIPDAIATELQSNKILKYDKYIIEYSSGNKLRQYRPLIENLHNTDEYFSDYSRAVIKGALWKGFYSDMMNLAKEGACEFKNGKKPKRLIKQILKYTNRSNAIVLDFFAGSGTTAEAVLDMNRKDGGKRQFVLCTNNQNKICEDITYRRIKTIISGKTDHNTIYSDGIKANLKYYKTDFISKKSDDLSSELLKHTKEMIELENHIEIDNDKYFMILTDDELDNLTSNISTYPNIEKIWVANDVLFTTEQKSILKDLEIIVIPDNYFKFELRDANELI